MSATPLRVTVFGENVHEHTNATVGALYPRGMHEAIADGLREHLGDNGVVRTVTLQQPEHGLTEEMLSQTDVLTWWGHRAHHEVDDVVVKRIQHHVLSGMGLLVLHSGHESKIFKTLMGTACSLRWREADDREIVWTVNPSHPIAAGVPRAFIIPRHEMYGEYFDIPQPDDLVFISSFSGGEIFRGGCCFRRGHGRIFYFSPGHETYPIYYQPEIKQVIANAVQWVRGSTPAEQRPMFDIVRSYNAPTGWFESL